MATLDLELFYAVYFDWSGQEIYWKKARMSSLAEIKKLEIDVTLKNRYNYYEKKNKINKRYQ
jgi:hypothetical protein